MVGVWGSALRKLRIQLESEPPPPRRIRARYAQQTDFQPGDIIRYQLLSGSHIYLRVAGLYSDKASVAPELGVLDWDSAAVPAEELPPGWIGADHSTRALS